MARSVPSTGYPPAIQRQIAEKLRAQQPAPARKNKYGAIPTHHKSVQGFVVRCDSKAEAAFFGTLDYGVLAKTIAWWLPHVRFPLPDGEVYESDALVVSPRPGGGFDIRVCDSKGRDTPASRAKRAFVHDKYGIEVEIIQSGKRK